MSTIAMNLVCVPDEVTQSIDPLVILSLVLLGYLFCVYTYMTKDLKERKIKDLRLLAVESTFKHFVSSASLRTLYKLDKESQHFNPEINILVDYEELYSKVKYDDTKEISDYLRESVLEDLRKDIISYLHNIEIQIRYVHKYKS